MLLRACIVGLLLSAFTMPVFAADDPVIAIVDGKKFHRSELEWARDHLPEKYKSVPFEQLYPFLLNSLVDSHLVRADARAKGLDKDPLYLQQVDLVESQMLERFAIHHVIEAALTDEALHKRYEDELKSGAGEEIHARHILVASEDDAKDIIRALDGGADFAELAKKKSTGPSASNGGDLGFFGHGQMVPTFEKAAYALEPGTYTKEPVKTEFGFHVIKVEERRKAEPASYEESLDRLRSEAAEEAGRAYVENLRAKANVQRFNPDGSKMQ